MIITMVESPKDTDPVKTPPPYAGAPVLEADMLEVWWESCKLSNNVKIHTRLTGPKTYNLWVTELQHIAEIYGLWSFLTCNPVIQESYSDKQKCYFTLLANVGKTRYMDPWSSAYTLLSKKIKPGTPVRDFVVNFRKVWRLITVQRVTLPREFVLQHLLHNLPLPGWGMWRHLVTREWNTCTNATDFPSEDFLEMIIQDSISR
ncbi:hypothetical protein MPH_08569 [Macrophomina phaseolina MS6]|uniref:Uncharacterized protein n=1 Tax=Macrophomina phaseolina (strain MS6) TaxID=1126212 RepID=K2RVQ1_MACPH|nr:hypothetical protein MPH_08569 [Macrophomina phaseolina MS6]